MVQVLLGEIWDFQTSPFCNVWSTQDQRNWTIIRMGNSTWNGETFRIVDPARTFARRSKCDMSLLDAYVGELEHAAWQGSSVADRVVAGLFTLAEQRLNMLEPSELDLRDIADDVNR